MLKKDIFTLTSPSDGLELSVLVTSPVEDADLRGVVHIVHGMSEYKERYLPLMEFLAENGFASIIHDHRGHGLSVKEDGDLGHMYEVGVDAFLDDIAVVNKYAKECFPSVPAIMLGHSMGSLAARCYLKKWGDTIDTLILSGSPKKNSAVGVARIVAKLWKKLFGSRKKSKLITALVFSPYVAAYKKEKSAFAWICKDPEMVRLYDEDEKCGFGFTVDGFSVLFDLLYRTYENKKFPYEKVNKELPIMFISGECDPCIDGAENFRKAMESVKSGGYVKVQGKLYETLRHEIFNEKEKITVFQDVLNFLEDNL